MRLSFVDGGKAPRAFTASTKGFYSGCVLKMTIRLRRNGIAINVLAGGSRTR